MSDLRLSTDLSLPLDAVTRTFAIVGQRGSGKTTTAAVLVEEMAASARFVVVDPTGAWFGLRSAADGKGPGLSVVVLGGHHGDAPLEESAGPLVADLVIREGLSLVLDLELLRKGQQIRFVCEFLEGLYHANREALHVVIDECQRFAPQVLRESGGYAARCLGAVEDIVKLGRRKGLGASVITQRPAELNKAVLEQAETLMVHRLQGPRDRKAIGDWFDAQGDPPGEAEALAALPTLKTGEAYVLSPSFLGFFGRVAVRPKRTYDSSATPAVGKRRSEPVGRAAIDLEAIRTRLASAIEKAKQDDPKTLRAEIADLRRQLAQRPTETKVETKIETKRVEVPVLTDDQVTELRFAIQRLADVGAGLMSTAETIGAALARATKPAPSQAPPRPVDAPRSAPAPRPPSTPTKAPLTPTDTRITGPQQRILDALASFEALGIREVSRSNVAVFADASPTSSGYQNNLSALRTVGLLDYPASGRLCLTETGRAIAMPKTSIGSVSQLHDAWCAKLSGPQGRILRTLAANYPNPLDREQLADQVDASATSSGFQNNLSALRSLGLLDYPTRGQVVATGLLFPEGVPA